MSVERVDVNLVRTESCSSRTKYAPRFGFFGSTFYLVLFVKKFVSFENVNEKYEYKSRFPFSGELFLIFYGFYVLKPLFWGFKMFNLKPQKRGFTP